MALNARPVLSTIPAFDADFGSPGKENIQAPIFKFSWKDGVVKKNKVVIRDYDTKAEVYNHTIETMSLKHQLHNKYNTSQNVKDLLYELKNGHKYIAQVYVYTSDGKESLPSNEVIFYCLETPTFNFTNFNEFIGEGNAVAIVNSNSVNLTVNYSQTNGETLKYYKFVLQDYNGNKLLESETKYSSLANDTLRYSLGGITETPEDKYGNLQVHQAYKIICHGETEHGIMVITEQRFVVKPIPSGVGALVKAKNSPVGNVTIYSNYKIMNTNHSTGNPIYIKDELGNPYAIDLNKDSVEFIDGFNILHPYEIIFSGVFKKGKLVTFESIYGTATVELREITYTVNPYYYFCFTIEEKVEKGKNKLRYEIRTNYFRYHKDTVDATIDLSYYKSLYNIKAKIIFNKAFFIDDDSKGNVTMTMVTEHTIKESNGIASLRNSSLTISDDSEGNVIIRG